MYSDEEGVNWSTPQLVSTSGGRTIPFATGQMFYNPEINKYCIIGCATNYSEIRFSEDGIKWTEKIAISENSPFGINESAGAYVGDGTIIVLSRAERGREKGHVYLQMVSTDNGQTWSSPEETNMPPNNHWGPAPNILYNKETDTILAFATDRRSIYEGSSSRAEESLYIFEGIREDIIQNPKTWLVRNQIKRPKQQSNFDFYGYPTFTKTGKNRYLVVYSDRVRYNTVEESDLYQFEILIGEESSEFISEVMILSKEVNGEFVFFEKTENGLVEKTVLISC